MASIINAATSGGLITTADTSGILNLQTAGTTAITVDASQNVGIGTTTPDIFSRGYGRTVGINDSGSSGAVLQINSASSYSALELGRGGVRKAFFTAQSTVTELGNLEAVPLAFYTNSAERARIDSSGNLGLGVTPSAWDSTYKAIQVGARSMFSGIGSEANMINNAYYNSGYKYVATSAAGLYTIDANVHKWYNAPSGTAGANVSFTQAMTLDASGNLLLGRTSANGTFPGLQVGDITTGKNILLTSSSAGNNGVIQFRDTADGNAFQVAATTTNISLYGYGSRAMQFYTNDAQRMRIDSSGNIFTSGNYSVLYPGSGNTTTGIFLESAGQLSCSRDNTTVALFNRNSTDGTLLSLSRQGTEIGTVSVSSGTVSYNAFAGSHWSQLSDGSKPNILRGTVLDSINELVQWPDEPTTERLCKVKVSDTAGSKKVYGVFMDWDNDWTATNDMYVTAVGAFICRVNASVTVQEGDLLESNGDGTARVQADDLIRSSTIGKVTCTEKTHQYDDGSYCVPTVLYCG